MRQEFKYFTTKINYTKKKTNVGNEGLGKKAIKHIENSTIIEIGPSLLQPNPVYKRLT